MKNVRMHHSIGAYEHTEILPLIGPRVLTHGAVLYGSLSATLSFLSSVPVRRCVNSSSSTTLIELFNMYNVSSALKGCAISIRARTAPTILFCARLNEFKSHLLYLRIVKLLNNFGI